MERKHMSAKYSLLVVAVVVAILIINSLWVKLASQQNTDIDSSAKPSTQLTIHSKKIDHSSSFC